MNPGMVVKLRPTGPWRIGPDSGARNRVDAIYHSDTLYGAVTSAMAALGRRDEWLDATARASAPAVCFSSCFPFLDELGFVAPPRTVWPPSSPGLMAARVRWKSARFVPLGIVQAILAGQRLDDAQWTVDGASECLVPAGRSGPFRTGVRWNAAVDRLTGAAERHSTACLEFRPGAGLWTVVSFANQAAHEQWSAPVKAAFRWLSDSGFGGERSRGWGRSEAPEFVEGTLPEMILGAGEAPAAPVPEMVPEVPVVAMAGEAPVAEAGGAIPAEPELTSEPEAKEPVEAAAPAPEYVAEAEERAAGPEPVEEPAPVQEPPAQEPSKEDPPKEEPPQEDPPVQEPAAEEPPAESAGVRQRSEVSPMTPGSRASAPFWLLSLYTPAAEDSVDWGRGSYSLVTRGGRVDASGDLKKQLPMVEEGSVVYAAGELRGSASDVAPDGFAHPVFRAGFAVSIPLPEVAG